LGDRNLVLSAKIKEHDTRHAGQFGCGTGRELAVSEKHQRCVKRHIPRHFGRGAMQSLADVIGYGDANLFDHENLLSALV